MKGGGRLRERCFAIAIFGTLLLPLLMASCQRNHADEISNETPDDIEMQAGGSADATDPFELLEAKIEGDSLLLSVRYGGGCSEHVFDLEAGPMLKSLPPKQIISIAHDANGDNCRALIQRTIAFDLSAYRGSPRGGTVIVVDGKELIYEYR